MAISVPYWLAPQELARGFGDALGSAPHAVWSSIVSGARGTRGADYCISLAMAELLKLLAGDGSLSRAFGLLPSLYRDNSLKKLRTRAKLEGVHIKRSTEVDELLDSIVPRLHDKQDADVGKRRARAAMAAVLHAHVALMAARRASAAMGGPGADWSSSYGVYSGAMGVRDFGARVVRPLGDWIADVVSGHGPDAPPPAAALLSGLVDRYRPVATMPAGELSGLFRSMRNMHAAATAGKDRATRLGLVVGFKTCASPDTTFAVRVGDGAPEERAFDVPGLHMVFCATGAASQQLSSKERKETLARAVADGNVGKLPPAEVLVFLEASPAETATAHADHVVAARGTADDADDADDDAADAAPGQAPGTLRLRLSKVPAARIAADGSARLTAGGRGVVDFLTLWNADHVTTTRKLGQMTAWCGLCGGRLTTPASIAHGVGPECHKKLAAVDTDATAVEAAAQARAAAEAALVPQAAPAGGSSSSGVARAAHGGPDTASAPKRARLGDAVAPPKGVRLSAHGSSEVFLAPASYRDLAYVKAVLDEADGADGADEPDEPVVPVLVQEAALRLLMDRRAAILAGAGVDPTEVVHAMTVAHLIGDEAVVRKAAVAVLMAMSELSLPALRAIVAAVTAQA
jgi:hypothetical protein